MLEDNEELIRQVLKLVGFSDCDSIPIEYDEESNILYVGDMFYIQKVHGNQPYHLFELLHISATLTNPPEIIHKHMGYYYAFGMALQKWAIKYMDKVIYDTIYRQ